MCLRCAALETLQNRREVGEQLKADVWLYERERGVCLQHSVVVVGLVGKSSQEVQKLLDE